jgi:catechol 2,3-dioxygenase-like lactoylglutathione lyase family enzyme
MAPRWRTSSLAVAIVSAARLEDSLPFYRDALGLEAGPEERWAGPSFERHWHLPPGSSARAILLGFPGGRERPRGRILLLEFDAGGRAQVRERRERAFVGLNNLNFYSFDIRQSVRQLRELGYEFWTDPVGYRVGEREGQATEALFEAPDGMIANLVEPAGGGDTLVGQVRGVLDERGSTPTGFTEVTTSAHTVRDMEEALRFFVGVLGFEIWHDTLYDMPEANRLLTLPDDARSRIVFVRGDDLFGKVALMQPLNYDVPELAARAVAPNIGYLAMSFECADLADAERACRDAGVVTYSEREPLEIPGLGTREALLVRTPGSDALVQLTS